MHQAQRSKGFLSVQILIHHKVFEEKVLGVSLNILLIRPLLYGASQIIGYIDSPKIPTL